MSSRAREGSKLRDAGLRSCVAEAVRERASAQSPELRSRVSVAIKETMPAGKYVVDCFMPSESDGMPHALMGMWKLFTVT